MKKKTKFNLLLLLLSFNALLISCSGDDDNTTPNTDNEVNNPHQNIHRFIWNGMNQVYLYKENVADLANNRFSSVNDQNKYFSTFATPEALYEKLKSTTPKDRFSFLTDDYIKLEQNFSGVSKSNGMDFGLIRAAANSNDVIGYVRYILPGTDAENKGIKRGDIFATIDGEKLTVNSNFGEIFGRDSYTVGFVSHGDLTPTKSVALTQVEYAENPVYIAKTIDYNGQKIGYLMYNGFTGDYDEQLNDAFGQFKTDGITDLVLDFRYNGGGSVRTAIDLSAMITGQFKGEVFSKEIWNSELTAHFQSTNPERLINRFQDTTRNGTLLNSLNLSKLYVLATDRTASASELVMNGLEPYIDIIHIGENTTGKHQASITLYDSPNFGREGASKDHTYAIQPLVLKSANKNGVTDYDNGLTPDFEFSESLANLGILGDVNEPFLKSALDHITNGTVPANSAKQNAIHFSTIGETKMFTSSYQRMYKEDVDLNFINE
ncbi:S41 family peptidase [Aquimarina hainanensis]|uniref:S41 family peptidase n=1 Tax=Aquimarina hainanensis TaxID=1578017 RepID=A0ABW5N963_9FLAO